MTRGEFLRNVGILAGGSTLAPSIMLDMYTAAQRTGSKKIADYFEDTGDGIQWTGGSSDETFTATELYSYFAEKWSEDGFNLNGEI